MVTISGLLDVARRTYTELVDDIAGIFVHCNSLILRLQFITCRYSFTVRSKFNSLPKATALKSSSRRSAIFRPYGVKEAIIPNEIIMLLEIEHTSLWVHIVGDYYRHTCLTTHG